MKTDTTAATATSTDLLDRLPGITIPLAILLLPATCRVIAINLSETLSFVPYLLLIIATVVLLRTARIHRNPAYLAGVLLAPLLGITMLASGSNDGLLLTISAFCGGGIVIAGARWDDDQVARRIALPLLLTASFQAVLVIAQTVTDRAVGLTWFAPQAELEVIDGLLRPQGTMSHVYEPAALGLLAAGVAIAVRPGNRRLQPVWLGGAALAGSTVGLTHSRAALFGLILMVPFVIIAGRRGDRHTWQVGAALLAGFAIAALLTSGAWAHRGDHSTAGGLDDASLGRITLAKQAIEMTVDHPIVGVGPGRYLVVLENDYGLDDRYPFIVHSVPMAVAAENGIPAALVLSLLVGWAVIRAVRASPAGAALAVSILGFVLFDAIHYDRGLGILMFGIWLAVLQRYQTPTSRLVKSE
ncbi:MAG: O-antigen ligase family protein [Acidimicrobiia bacterium]|nr:O-antigen ligase family protein [Acidimicrobiia bacterium]